MSFYDDLGVTSTATPEEIKNAYRAKAVKLHPDKGGDAVAFAQVALAYRTLSDEEKRAHYDRTGNDQGPPSIESEVQQVLLQLFATAMKQPEDRSVLFYVRESIERGQHNMQLNRATLLDMQARLEAKRGKITTKAEVVNIADMLIDQELRQIESQLKGIAHQEEIQRLALVELESYEEEKPPEPKAGSEDFNLRRLQDIVNRYEGPRYGFFHFGDQA